MKNRSQYTCALFTLILGLVLVPARISTQTSRSAGTLSIGVTEVVLDVVVTDKKGRQIKDLSPEDFEVLEDGVKQQMTSIRLAGAPLEGRSKTIESPTTTQPQPEPTSGVSKGFDDINLITMVFDRISPYGRQMAKDAASEYFSTLSPTDFVSVVAIDRTLRVLQPFTNDVKLLNAAVGLAAEGTPQQFAETSDAVRDSIEQSQLGESALTSVTQSAGPTGGPGAGVGDAASQVKLNEMVGNMLRLNTVADESIQGRATVEGLMSIIRAEQSMPGRKAVVFFAERIALPTQVIERFRDLISAANRSNVSFYCVDATGLRSAGELAEMSRELRTVAAVSQRQQTRRAGAVTREEVTLTENAENVLRMSSQNSLSDLATSTGGILISNTNDLRAGLQHVSEDLHSHYELSYVPKNTVYDGSFRKVEVKVKRSGVVTRSRNGYYAIRSEDAAVSSYEIPLLTAIESKVLPRDIGFRSTSLLYPTRGAKAETVLYLEVPLTEFSFPLDKSKNEYEAKVDVLVQVKNPAGRTIEKFSQEFPLRGPKEKADDTRAMNLVFYRTAELAPGRYTVEAVVKDGFSKKVSVKRSVVVVPPQTQANLALSSVVLVKRVDPVQEDGLAVSPLQLGDQRVVPLLDTQVNSVDWQQLSFYFVAVAPPGDAGAMVDLIISKDGKPIGHMGEKPLPAADRKGRIPYLASLPTSILSSGNYDVSVVVSKGEATATATALFSVQ